MKRKLILLGGGGHASDVLAAIEGSAETYEVLVADDGVPGSTRFVGRAGVLTGTLEEAFQVDAVFMNAIGYPRSRMTVVERADSTAVRWAECVVHRDASIHPSVQLSFDSVVLGQTWISAHVSIGPHSSVGYGVTIGHDVRLAGFAAVMPGASIGGDVTVGRGVLVGANATVLQGLQLGDGATIGAGAVVTADVEAGSVVVGVPARNVGS